MPRPTIAGRAMTNAERQARFRAAHAVTAAVVPHRPTADRRSRATRWRDAVAEITALQAEYANWLEAMPGNLHDTATADALQLISDLDLADLHAITPPKGFGRD